MDARRDGRTHLASLRREREQGNINFPCSVDHEQDWQAYPVDPHSAKSADHTYILYTICTLALQDTSSRCYITVVRVVCGS